MITIEGEDKIENFKANLTKVGVYDWIRFRREHGTIQSIELSYAVNEGNLKILLYVVHQSLIDVSRPIIKRFFKANMLEGEIIFKKISSQETFAVIKRNFGDCEHVVFNYTNDEQKIVEEEVEEEVVEEEVEVEEEEEETVVESEPLVEEPVKEVKKRAVQYIKPKSKPHIIPEPIAEEIDDPELAEAYECKEPEELEVSDLRPNTIKFFKIRPFGF